MTKNRFKIIDEEFISYYGGNGCLISNGNCEFWLWHDKSGSQKVCDKLNIIMEENKQLEIDILGQSEEIEVLSDENKRLKQENKRLKQGKYIYGVHGGSNNK